jgi:hypothetical protein
MNREKERDASAASGENGMQRGESREGIWIILASPCTKWKMRATKMREAAKR